MSGKILGLISSMAALALLAGCSSTGEGGMFGMSKKTDAPAAAEAANKDSYPVVVQGMCPQVYLRDGTAVFSQYVKGAKKNPDGSSDPDKLVIQATLDQTTRQCFQTDQGLRMTVVVHGRVVPGPAGKAGSYTLPIRVAATDGDATLYSELTKFTVNVPSDLGAAQFVFTKENIVLSQGATGLTRLFAGIDEGPYNTK